MDKVLNSFINEHKDAFNEHFNYYVKDKLLNREDYKEITNKIHNLYEKYPNLREFIEDEKPTSFNVEETDAFCEWLGLYDSLKIIELLEAFKLGGKEAYIFFEEQGMLNI